MTGVQTCALPISQEMWQADVRRNMLQEFGEGVDRLYEVMESEELPQPEYKTQAFKLSATIRNTKTDGNLWAAPQATPQATFQAEQTVFGR